MGVPYYDQLTLTFFGWSPHRNAVGNDRYRAKTCKSDHTLKPATAFKRSIWIGWGLGLLLPLVGMSQPVQWASRVVAFSSENRSLGLGQQYNATQALGAPSVLPQVVVNPCAWAPASTDANTTEAITVAFARPQPIRQVLVAESANPGAIVQVIVYDQKQQEHVVFSEKQAISRAADKPIDPLLRIILPDSSLIGQQIRVVLDPSRTRGLNQIDAIGITTSSKPIVLGVNVAPGTPTTITKVDLGPSVNTKGIETSPIISPDGETLFFTRSGHRQNVGDSDKQDVWFAQRTPDRSWGEARNLGPPINTVGNNAVCSISPDGRTLFLINAYKADGGLEFGLSTSTLSATGWTFPQTCQLVDINQDRRQKYDKEGNEEAVELDYTVGPDGRTMLIAIEMKQSTGDRDLYVSFKQSDHTWSKPRSLGTSVNTAAEESAPFLAADNRTLYFTSEGYPGYGKGDIFMTRRLDDTWTRWSTPENLGPGVNTSDQDRYFSIPASGDYAYLSTKNDLFQLKLYPAARPTPVAIVSGQVLDALTKKPVPVEVLAGLAGQTEPYSQLDYDPATGDYKLVLPLQQTFTLTARRDGYFAVPDVLDLSRDKRFRTIRRNLYVTPIQPGAKIVLRGVLFVQSEAVLLPGSETELDQLTALLTQHPTMTILVEGHTDNQGDWALNIKLSEDRVQRVKQYLMGKGVAETRIQTKAWGPSKPIASNESEEKRRLNRRVEFTILTL